MGLSVVLSRLHEAMKREKMFHLSFDSLLSIVLDV